MGQEEAPERRMTKKHPKRIFQASQCGKGQDELERCSDDHEQGIVKFIRIPIIEDI